MHRSDRELIADDYQLGPAPIEFMDLLPVFA
jgi:hypothetical protein